MKLKKILAALLSASMLVCFSACGEKENQSSESENEIATETVAVESEEPETEETTEATEEEQDITMGEPEITVDSENPEQTVLAVLKEGFKSAFGENMEVTYDDETSIYSINVWQEGFASALETDAGVSALNELSSALTSSLQIMSEQIRVIDEDAAIELNFLSDLDQSVILLTIVDGEMTYNITE